MHTIKPLDKDAIVKAAKETGHIITVEDHLITGGLGSAVAETLADAGIGVPFRRLGIPGEDFPPLATAMSYTPTLAMIPRASSAPCASC